MSRYRNAAIPVLAAVALAIPAVAANAATSQPADEAATDSGGLIHYQFEPSTLPDARFESVNGIAGSDASCVFEEGSLANPQEGYVEVGTEVSYDPATCESTYAVAVYPIDEVPDTVIQEYLGGAVAFESFIAGAQQEQAAEQEQAAASSADVVIMAAQSASLMTAYRDPVLLHVTRATTNLNWTGTNTCISAASATHPTYHLTATGWSRTSMTPSFTFSCSQAHANTNAKFKNDAFCPGSGNTTYTNHTGTHVYGYPGGPSSHSRTMTKSGGCNNLLHTTYAWTP